MRIATYGWPLRDIWELRQIHMLLLIVVAIRFLELVVIPVGHRVESKLHVSSLAISRFTQFGLSFFVRLQSTQGGFECLESLVVLGLTRIGLVKLREVLRKQLFVLISISLLVTK